MNKEINKQISQFLDDELHHQELENLLVQLNKQPEFKDKLDRYQMVSHALRTDCIVKTNNDFLNSIKQSVQREPHHFLPNQATKIKPTITWYKTSLALAASIACVSVIVFQQTEYNNSSKLQNSLMLSQQNTKNNTAAVPRPALKVAQEQPIIKHTLTAKIKPVEQTQHERFKAYLQAHSNDLYTHGSLNIRSYARVAGYGQE